MFLLINCWCWAMLASIKTTTLTVLVAVNAGKHHLMGAGKLLPHYVWCLFKNGMKHLTEPAPVERASVCFTVKYISSFASIHESMWLLNQIHHALLLSDILKWFRVTKGEEQHTLTSLRKSSLTPRQHYLHRNTHHWILTSGSMWTECKLHE